MDDVTEKERQGMRRAISVLTAAVEPFSGGGPKSEQELFEAIRFIFVEMLEEADDGTNEAKFLDSFSALLCAFVVLVDASHEAVGRHTPEEKRKVLEEIAFLHEVEG